MDDLAVSVVDVEARNMGEMTDIGMTLSNARSKRKHL